MDIHCKSCGSSHKIKNGKIRSTQRYKCKACGYNFIEGDRREKVLAGGKVFAVLLYGRGKLSYGVIAKLFGVSRTVVMKWIKRVAGRLPEPVFDESVTAVQFDEMWHFVNQKKKNCGYGGLWTAIEIKPLDGMLAIVLLRHSESFSISSNI